jgi:hypothetical protein
MSSLYPERCSVRWCNRESYSWTFCALHYRRAKRHDGNPVTEGEEAAYQAGLIDGATEAAVRIG